MGTFQILGTVIIRENGRTYGQMIEDTVKFDSKPSVEEAEEWISSCFEDNEGVEIAAIYNVSLGAAVPVFLKTHLQ